jgi:hypothetical protein
LSCCFIFVSKMVAGTIAGYNCMNYKRKAIVMQTNA